MKGTAKATSKVEEYIYIKHLQKVFAVYNSMQVVVFCKQALIL